MKQIFYFNLIFKDNKYKKMDELKRKKKIKENHKLLTHK